MSPDIKLVVWVQYNIHVIKYSEQWIKKVEFQYIRLCLEDTDNIYQIKICHVYRNVKAGQNHEKRKDLY